MTDPSCLSSLLMGLNRLHFPISSLGFGKRIGIWFQGCSIHCAGCISRDTWEPAQQQVLLSDVTTCIERWLEQADGLTISGGEPFDQPTALLALVQWWRKSSSGDILIYSGYAWQHLQDRFPAIVQSTDIIISEPFELAAGQDLELRGSNNQQMHLLSRIAIERYTNYHQQQTLDICWSDDSLWIAGIPKPADMKRVREHLRQLGITARTSDQLGEIRA